VSPIYAVLYVEASLLIALTVGALFIRVKVELPTPLPLINRFRICALLAGAPQRGLVRHLERLSQARTGLRRGGARRSPVA
jgi:hypothetical protein